MLIINHFVAATLIILLPLFFSCIVVVFPSFYRVDGAEIKNTATASRNSVLIIHDKAAVKRHYCCFSARKVRKDRDQQWHILLPELTEV